MSRPTTRLRFAAACLALGIGLGIASITAQGPLLGDIAITKALQSILGPEPAWAGPVTKSAKFPLAWITLAFGCGLGWIRGGWRAPTATLIAFAAVNVLDSVLRRSFHTPKPIAEWVTIASPSQSSGFPSTFGLVYAAIFGCVLFATAKPGWQSNAIAVFAATMLLIGSLSRLVLGGHWTSQLVASLLIAFAIVLVIQQLLETKREARSENPNE